MSFNVEFAIRVAERLRKYVLRWLEEPLIPSDLEGHIELKKAINWVPLATGEDHHGRHAFRQLIEHRAIDIAQPDLKWCGGLTEAVKIYTIAEAAGIAAIPHAGAGTPYGQHFSFAMPESPMAEFWGQVPGRGVRVRHPDCTAQAAADCVSGASCSASCFVVTPGCQVATTYCPLVVLFSEYRTDEPAHRRTVREDAHHICPSPDLLCSDAPGGYLTTPASSERRGSR